MELLKATTPTTPEVLVLHAHAALTPGQRLRLAHLIVEDGWPAIRAAERFNVSATTARRWAERYRAEGKAGMVDRPAALIAAPPRPVRPRPGGSCPCGCASAGVPSG